jgi:alkanesulfonate monooxygenase SsuD/methylene tetrahydromethanopterin reductase-like flavin-dependent oxidoreductase (luciferase family)
MRLSVCLDPARAWHDIEHLARLVDDGPWHAVYVCDHFMPHRDDDRPAGGPMLECWTTLSAIAAVTRRVRLGPLVLGNTYRRPAVVANMAASLDQVSDGRVLLGLGAGWQRSEHFAYGIDLPAAAPRIAALDEACVVIRRLLDDEVASFTGTYYRLDDARCEPKPVQARLPLLIGGSGPRLLTVAARHADVWHTWADPGELRAKNAVVDQLCEELGRDPTSLGRASGGTIAVTPPGCRPAVTTEPADVSGGVGEVVRQLLEYRDAGADEFVVVDDASSTTVNQATSLLDLIEREVAPQLRETASPVRE